jgi:type IV pilus assembly protein PilY1
MKLTQANILACMAFLGLACAPIQSHATLTNPNGPLYVATSIAPLVMLDITKDQNLYKKLFNDVTDLDGDGILDTTYKHNIDYYGYFDSYKCYTYSTTNGYFSPVSASYSESSGSPVKPTDCGGAWHGNFLNWASMTRMDAVRKLLYGGYRSTDGTGASGTTILERSFITTDAHSFAKYYNPDIASVLDPVVMETWPSGGLTIGGFTYTSASDYTSKNYLAISKLTPYTPTTTPSSIASTSSVTLGTGVKVFSVPDTTKFSYGDQLMITDTAGDYMIGAVACVNGTGITMYDSLFNTNPVASAACSSGKISVVVENASSTSSTATTWKIQNWTQTGLTMCNTTIGSSSGANQKSQTNTNPPLLRVAYGNFSMWAANERWQCRWREDSVSPGENTGTLSGGTLTQGNRAAVSGLYASSIGPNETTSSSGRITNGVAGSNSDLTVRVQACVTGAIGQENCELYPSGDYKPVGLLQTYGETGLLKFGLMTGSYTDNQSGGVLRKNIGSMANEINTSTDGTFVTTVPTGGGIVNTLNKMRIFGYNYGDGTYDVDSTTQSAFCTWGQTTFSQGQCLSWGNPMSEVYLESLRYFAGQTATTAFNADDSSLISGLTTANWSDPISTSNYCAPLNVLVFNASTSSYDANINNTDQMGGISDLGATVTAAQLTDYVAGFDGINGNSWFVGNTPTSPTGTNANICSVKTVSNLSTVNGICPEGPATQGGYLMAGAALYSHTNRIRSGTPFSIPATDTTSLLVNSYGVALASSVPQINVTIGSKTVILQPATLNNLSGGNASGTLVDFEKVCEIPTTASAANIAAVTQKSAGTCSKAGASAFYVNWEDSAQGGDYDQDMWGRLRYQITGSTLTVTTDVIAQSTPDVMGFGYSIQGTTQDGPHFHSGINSFQFTDSTNITVTGASDIYTNGGCNGCVVGDAATSATYTLATTTTSSSLHDPLWYLAKWGGFTGSSTAKGGTSQTTNPITSVSQWDVKNADGSTTGCTSSAGCDGIPDNYYPVTNPNALETALDQAFAAMLNSTSASSVATNSTSLKTGSQIFQASFNSNNWSGVLSAFNLVISTDPSINGTVKTPAAWADGGEDAGGVTDNFDSQTSSSTSRAILTYGLDTLGGIPFEWSNISSQTSTTQATYLNTNQSGTADGKGSLRVAYLRGDRSNEGTKTTNFRERNSELGDIINSSPTYIGAPEQGWAGSSYQTFVTTYQNRTAMVYAGANDGMLHGFSAADGTEKIAYVPNEVYANLSQYPAQNYSHRYYVDGTPMVNDIQVGATPTWKTYLVGGLNWGGRAYYALDVTDPSTFSETNAASIVKWEFSHTIDGDLGYTFMQPTYPAFKGTASQIVLMHNGKWALIAGNGYDSDHGKAALFIIFLDHSGTTWTAGTDYIKLVADSTGPNNGMSTPVPYDFDNDGVVDYIYAGDLQGNLWKFDVTSATASNWSVAFSGSPLFVAKDSSGNRQPITTAPTVTQALTAPSEVGAMIDFGTGQYLQSADVVSPYSTQTLYGIWDSASNQTVSGRSQLVQQTVTSSSSTVLNTTTNSTNSYRLVSSNTVTLSQNSAPTANDGTKGWYMDLPSSSTTGERVAYNPVLNDGVFLAVTLIPSATPCLAGGTSWIMALNAFTGTSPSVATFDVNGDGQFNQNDLVTTGSGSSATTNVPAGMQLGGGGIMTTVTLVKDQNNARDTHFYSSTSNGQTATGLLQGALHSSGRIDWREVNQ